MAKPPDLFRFNYILLCDDIRREDNGKEILIGVYNDEMIVRTAPAALTSLHFRVSFYPKKTSPRDFSFSVIAPNGLSIVQAEGQLSAELNYDVQSVVNIASKPLLLPEHGAYSMRFGLGKKENEVDVGRFMVRKPANDEENNRLPK